MPEQLALQKQEQQAITPMDPMQLMGMALQKAIDQGSALEVVDRLIKGQREMIEYRDRAEWNEAMARCQAKMRQVARDAKSDKGKYASYAQLDACLRPIYMDEGFSISFNEEVQDNPDMVRVACTVARTGHERVYRMDIPADGKGARGNDVMTKTHAHGSAVTYGKRYLLNMIFNVAVGDKDDDGRAAGGKAMGALSENDQCAYQDNIRNAPTKADLQKFYLSALKAAEDIGDASSVRVFIKLKDERLRQL